jgi:hypothetical protein
VINEKETGNLTFTQQKNDYSEILVNDENNTELDHDKISIMYFLVRNTGEKLFNILGKNKLLNFNINEFKNIFLNTLNINYILNDYDKRNI